MSLQEFRLLVRSEFGGDLRHMTPANVREFLDRVGPEVDGSPAFGGRISLNEPEGTYEGIVRDYFHRVLEMPPDQAVIRLWLYSLDLAIAGIAEVEEEKLRSLFADLALDSAD